MFDPDQPYQPPPGLSSPHLQSILSSSPLRRHLVQKRGHELLAAAREEIIETPSGARLQGFRSSQQGAASRGLVILLHGWEGSVDSSYMLSTAAQLFARGFDIFRLNFRDHGDSHHLNEDLFHSCLIEEVTEAVQQVAADWQQGAVWLAGFSLGGNFALRVALRAPAYNIELQRVVAVCPVIRPANVLLALEQGLPVYHYYFTRKWRRSLRRKQALFPHRYDFSEWFKINSLREQTRHLVDSHTEFPDVETYLEGYSVAGDKLAGLQVATTIITAVDDPVVPVSDFHSLTQPPALELRIERAGGHCGFISDWRLHSWIDQYLIHRFENEAAITSKT
ncbi:MAG: alpha/beta fold hydrolase [Wenzhouxiangellaceae bacterium]